MAPHPEDAHPEGELGSLVAGGARQALQTLADELKVGVGIFDASMNAVEGLDRIGFHPFCNEIRCSKRGMDACLRSDRQIMDGAQDATQRTDNLLAEAEALRKQPATADTERKVHELLRAARAILMDQFECPLGLLDLCYPLRTDGGAVGYLFMGQIRHRDIDVETCRRVLEWPLREDPSADVQRQAEFITAYYSIPRRNQEVIHLYRMLRQFALLFSGILQDRHVLSHAVELTNSSTPLADTPGVLTMLFEHSPMAQNARIEIWHKESSDRTKLAKSGRKARNGDTLKGTRTQGAGTVAARRAALERRLPQPLVRVEGIHAPARERTDDEGERDRAPRWVGILGERQSPGPIDKDAAINFLYQMATRGDSEHMQKQAELALAEPLPASFLASPLRSGHGASLGTLVVTFDELPEEDEREARRWMQITAPLIAATVRRLVEHVFLRTIYSTRNLDSLARIVQAGLPAVLGFGTQGACTVFHVEQGDDGTPTERLVPPDPQSVREGYGPGAGQGDVDPRELTYLRGEGQTGWFWDHGLWFHEHGLAFQLRENSKAEESFAEFEASLARWGLSLPEGAGKPEWAGKIRAQDEYDATPKTVAFVPIVDAHRVRGVIRLVRTPEAGLLSESEVSLVYAVAEHVITVMRTTDATNLANALSFEPLMVQTHEAMKDVSLFLSLASDPVANREQLDQLEQNIAIAGEWMRTVTAVGIVITGGRRGSKSVLRPDDTVADRLDRLGLHPSKVPVRRIIDRALERAKGHLDPDRDAIGWERRSSPDEDAEILCHEETTVTVVAEALRNAIKHNRSESGYPKPVQRVRVGVESSEDGVAQVRIFVEDEGPPFDAHLIEELQDIRERPEGAMLTTKGTGLLINALAMRIHGGWLGVDSEESDGFTKRVKLVFPSSDRVLE
ncbi:MAG: hypothetical protein GY851_05685 [bacterium]|nr:hypothetical protein [bacterium]